jgi:two-component system chemotaxis response regulator CheB
MMGKLRVLVVEDSITIRRRLVEVLSQDGGFEVVAEAADGQQAIERCLELRPDAVTMDMMLPSLNGLAATEYIMAHCPTPILVVSSSLNRGEVYNTYDALAAGAVDVIEKPRGDEAPGVWEQMFLSALRIVARIRVITHPRARLNALRGRTESSRPAPLGDGRLPLVLAFGASTGGPGALVSVLSHLPAELAAPALVVLHIGPAFAVSFASWLSTQVPRRVSYARGGELLGDLQGQVIMAPPDRHMVVQGSRLALTDDPERHSCRPSVDVLFESVALACGDRAAGCLLTGMGRDGALGLLAMRRAGAATVAQDEASSVVYGMSREAAVLGAAEQILPLSEVGPVLLGLAQGRSRSFSR